MESAVQLDGTLNDISDRDTGWTAETRIPWTAFDAEKPPRAGDRWLFAGCRYDFTLFGFCSPVCSTTAMLPELDFHLIDEFDWLLFSE